jgi:hypothetical protein
MDELFALLSAVKDGEVSETQAIKRLSRSPHWVWRQSSGVSLGHRRWRQASPIGFGV